MILAINSPRSLFFPGDDKKEPHCHCYRLYVCSKVRIVEVLEYSGNLYHSKTKFI